MRYEVIHDDERPQTFYVFDKVRGVVASNGYLNMYMAQTYCDKLNEIEEE